MHHTGRRVFELSHFLGLHLLTEIAISLAFTTSLSGIFAKGMKAAKTKKQMKKPRRSPSMGLHKGTN